MQINGSIEQVLEKSKTMPCMLMRFWIITVIQATPSSYLEQST